MFNFDWYARLTDAETRLENPQDAGGLPEYPKIADSLRPFFEFDGLDAPPIDAADRAINILEEAKKKYQADISHRFADIEKRYADDSSTLETRRKAISAFVGNPSFFPNVSDTFFNDHFKGDAYRQRAKNMASTLADDTWPDEKIDMLIAHVKHVIGNTTRNDKHHRIWIENHREYIGQAIDSRPQHRDFNLSKLQEELEKHTGHLASLAGRFESILQDDKFLWQDLPRALRDIENGQLYVDGEGNEYNRETLIRHLTNICWHKVRKNFKDATDLPDVSFYPKSGYRLNGKFDMEELRGCIARAWFFLDPYGHQPDRALEMHFSEDDRIVLQLNRDDLKPDEQFLGNEAAQWNEMRRAILSLYEYFSEAYDLHYKIQMGRYYSSGSGSNEQGCLFELDRFEGAVDLYYNLMSYYNNRDLEIYLGWAIGDVGRYFSQEVDRFLRRDINPKNIDAIVAKAECYISVIKAFIEKYGQSPVQKPLIIRFIRYIEGLQKHIQFVERAPQIHAELFQFKQAFDNAASAGKDGRAMNILEQLDERRRDKAFSVLNVFERTEWLDELQDYWVKSHLLFTCNQIISIYEHNKSDKIIEKRVRALLDRLVRQGKTLDEDCLELHQKLT